MLLVLGIFFEFIYELNFGSTMVQTDKYIFAIDNSGSMQDNDPNQERVAAIKKLLANREDNAQDFEFNLEDMILEAATAQGIEIWRCDSMYT